MSGLFYRKKGPPDRVALHILFLFVTILAQAFLALVGSDFMAFLLLSARHDLTLALDFKIDYAVLKFAGELECGHCTFWNRNFLVGLGVASHAGLTGFEAEGAKATDFDVVAFCENVFDALKKGVDYYGYVFADNTGVFRDFLYEIGFCHYITP